MPLREKIHSKRYLIYSIINFGLIAIAMNPTIVELLILTMVGITAIANQYMLLRMVETLLKHKKSYNKIADKNLSIFFLAFAKLGILGFSFAIAANYAKSKIIYIVFYYIFQIFILGFSSKDDANK